MYAKWEKNNFRVDPSMLTAHLPDLREIGEYLSDETESDKEFGDDDGPL